MENGRVPKGNLLILDEIMNKRSNPAVIILNLDQQILFFNMEGQEFLELEENPSGTIFRQELFALCERLKEQNESDFKNSCLIRIKDQAYVAVAHFINPPDGKDDLHIIVIIQPVAESHIDIKKIQEQYRLTPREIEVLALVCAGFSNREISEKLFISEYTTQDHLKNIMRKMDVSSRSKLIALVI
jgi:DNA-binding CsgD family transcriptional regulator